MSFAGSLLFPTLDIPTLSVYPPSRSTSTGTASETLLGFTEHTFPTYRANWHHRLLADRLEAVERGDLRRLMVFMPPRHGKSELVSVRFPAWYLGRNPDHRVIGTSYAARLAERFSGMARNLFTDARWPFPIELREDTKSKQVWDVVGHRGGYIAAGVGGPITGFGGELVIIDDPVKNREEADSETYREAVWDWYQSTLYTRLEGNAAIVLVMTRWHEDDLAGRLLAEAQQGGEQWDVLSLAAIAEHDEPQRDTGAPLWPEKYSTEALEATKTTIGSRNWNALYQQRPSSEEGAMFKRQWFSVVPSAPEGLRWVRYWDLAASTKTSADYTASAAVALGDDGTLFVRDMVRGRWEWPDARKIMTETMLGENGTQHAVEEALHGLAALQELRRDPGLTHIAIRGVKVGTDKVSRAMAWSARAEAKKVALVQGAWVNDFIHEACSFPHGAHDDQVDSVSGGAIMLTTKRKMQVT